MERLSTYMAAASRSPLPPEVTEKAKQHILDTFAAMVSGTTLPAAHAVLAYARQCAGAGTATVVGTDLVCGFPEAALVNGMLAHTDETDDSHALSHSHPGCAIVPAALSAGQQFSIGGEQFLRAVTLGYDIGTRVTMTLGGLEFQVRSHHDAHSIANTFGSSAAAGSAASLNPRQMRFLVDYAAQQASGIAAWQRDREHIEKSFVFGGGPARNGVTAALLVHAGATGIDDIFSGPDNFLLAFSPGVNPQGLIEHLGDRYEITETNIKKWSVGSPIQAALDALQTILRQHSVQADQVERVVVRLATDEAETVNNREMPDISLQQMIAVMLLKGTVTFRAAHDRAAMADPAVVRERAKVALVPDAALQKLYPKLAAIVTLTTTDGRSWTERVDNVRGTTGNPMTREEVVEKSRDLMEPALGSSQTSRLIAVILTLEKTSNLSELGTLLRKT